MEEAIKRELNELCRDILNDQEQVSVDRYLRRTRMLEEKLILMQYLKHREKNIHTEDDPASTAYDEEIENTLDAAETQRQESEARAANAHRAAEAPEPAPPASTALETSGPDEQKQSREASEPVQQQVSQKPATPPEPLSESPIDPDKLKRDRTPVEATQAPQREHEKPLEKKRSVNEQFVGHIKLGLNDRLAFVKHLFGGSQEDLNRVLSQLNTFDSYEEAEHFLAEMVKPDYDWRDKEEYEERLQELVKAKFGE